MNEDILQEKLEKYVRGLLPTAEAAAFERDINSNSDLQEQVRLHRLELESTEYLVRENVRQQAKAWLAETRQTPQKKTLAWGPKAILFLILALILTGIGIYQINKPPSVSHETPEIKQPEQASEKPIAEDSNPPQTPDSTPSSGKNKALPSTKQSQPVLASLYQLPRNLSEGVLKSTESAPLPETPLSAGILAFQSSDYNQAIREFSAIQEANAPLLYAQAQEWLAHSWLKKGFKTGDFKPAAQLFEARVAQNTNDAAQDQAEWYWTLSLYGNYAQNKEKVQALLQKMAADEYHTYRPKAQQLLGELNTQRN